MGKLSQDVEFLENKVIAFEGLCKETIQNHIKSRGGNISLLDLTYYDWVSSSLENYFYPMRQEDRDIGLILPFRQIILHSGEIGMNNLHALMDFSTMNKYKLGYYEFAWQHAPVIEGLIKNIPLTEYLKGLVWQVE